MKTRYEERISASIPLNVTTTTAGPPMQMITRDLCAGGAYVESALPFRVGELIVCDFSLPNSEKRFSFFAEVVRVEESLSDINEGAVGFGLEFLDTTPLDRIEIRARLHNYQVSDSPRDRAWFH